MKTRILVLLMAVLLLVPCFAACTSSGGDETDVTTTQPQGTTGGNSGNEGGPVGDIVIVDKDGFEIDDLMLNGNPDFGAETINVLAWSDYTMQEFEPKSETLTGDIVDDALFKRNDAVENRLNVAIEYTYEKGSASYVTEFIKNVEVDRDGDKAFDYIAGYSRTGGTLALRGFTADLLELDYINLSKPWWPESLVDTIAIGDRVMFCSGDISTNLLWMMQATFYNKNLITTYGLEDPYDLVKSNEWTIDKLISMCEGKANLVDGKKDASDTYGYTSYETCIDDFGISFDIICVNTKDGELALSGAYESQKVSDAVTKIRNWLASDDVWHEDSTKARNVFFEERAIFTNDRLFIIAGKDSSDSATKIEFEYGLVPNPKWNSKQANYITNLGHPFTTYSVPNYIPEERQNRAAAVLEVMSSENHRKVIPQVFELAMKVKYSDGDASAEMFDLVRETLHFDPSRIYSIGGEKAWACSGFRRVILGSGAWASEYKSNDDYIKNDIEKINTSLAQ